MAALPYMQFYVSDYLADTVHLTAEEHGAYLLLIMNYWQTAKPIPKKRLEKIARVPSERWESVQDALSEYFVDTGSEWVHERIEHDLNAVTEAQAQRIAAGKASSEARKRAKQLEKKRISSEITAPAEQPLQRESNDRSTTVQRESNDRSTTVQRESNDRSTTVQRESNDRSTNIYVDTDTEIDTEQNRTDQSLDCSERDPPPPPSIPPGAPPDRPQERVVLTDSKTVPENPQQWLAWFSTGKGFAHHEIQTTSTLPMFVDWCRRGISIGTVEYAMVAAHAALGGIPKTPKYYATFVDRFLMEHQRIHSETRHEPGQGQPVSQPGSQQGGQSRPYKQSTVGRASQAAQALIDSLGIDPDDLDGG